MPAMPEGKPEVSEGEERYAICIVGGATAGAEAAGVFSDRGILTVVIEQNDRWTMHEVVLDVWEDVFAWGYLILPNDMRPGERLTASLQCHQTNHPCG